MGHETKPIRFHLATYNVHKCRGMDGRTKPSRIASVLKGLKADVVALQEVIGAGPGGRGQEEEIGAQLNMVIGAGLGSNFTRAPIRQWFVKSFPHPPAYHL